MFDQYWRVYEAFHNRLRFVGGRWASRCRPTSISILLTERCNARCLHCDIWKNKGKEDSPSPDEWMAVLRDLRQWLGPVRVTLTGGEALLKPFAIDVLGYGSQIGLRMELLSHGYWDDQSKFEKLALAGPWRVTFSLDGLGETHSRIRGREDFFDKTRRSITTLQRVRTERALNFGIRLKTVIMDHNLDDLSELARFASQPGMDVFYQPIEQNYNTVEDPTWYLHSENWPRSEEKVISAIEKLIAMKRNGSHIANSYSQLKVMIAYFRNPEPMRVMVQSHNAHERRRACSSLINLQIHSNGDVRACVRAAVIGNVRARAIRQIWEQRPRLWENGCCLQAHPTAEQLRVV